MRNRPKVVWVLLSIALGLVSLAAALFWGLSSPIVRDRCVAGFEQCRRGAEGILGAVDCRIEMLHCRADGPEHWAEVSGQE